MMRPPNIAPTPTDESRFDRASWVVLGVASFVMVASLALLLYRTTLPTDGWRVQVLEEPGQRIEFDRNVRGAPSPLEEGDVLVAVDWQSTDDILTRASTFNPRRPPTWEDGGTVQYTVLRDGELIALRVRLQRLPISSVFANLHRELANALDTLPFVIIGTFVFALRPRNHAARLLFLVGVVLVAEYVVALVDSSLVQLFDRFAAWPTELFGWMLFIFFVLPAFPHLFLIFPVVKRPMRRQPQLTLAALYGAMPVLALLAAFLRRDDLLDLWPTFFDLFFLPAWLLLFAIAGISVVHTFRTAHAPVARAQMRWVAFGALIGLVGTGLTETLAALGVFNWQDVFGVESGVFMAALPLALAVAILRYRLFDIDVIIHRTLVYGTLTASLAAIYVVIIVSLQALLDPLIGDSDLTIAAATLCVAALVRPARNRIQTAVDRRFYRRKYDAAQTLAGFSQRLRDEIDLDEIERELHETVSATMQPAHISLWLRTPSRG